MEIEGLHVYVLFWRIILFVIFKTGNDPQNEYQYDKHYYSLSSYSIILNLHLTIPH